MKKLLTLALVLVLALGAMGTVASAEGEKNLTFIMNRDVVDMGPWAVGSASNAHIQRLLYNYLFAVPYYGCAADGFEPQIAKSYTMKGDVTIEVELYDYVHDQVGNPIKAEDVVFSYINKCEYVAGTNVKAALKSITAIDDTHVEIVMNDASVGNLELMLSDVGIVSKTWWESATDAQRATSPVGTGTYKLVDMVSGAHASFTKDENYWQADDSLRTYIDHQPFDNITFNVVLESAMSVIGLENHEADIARQIPIVELDTFMTDEWTMFQNVGGMFYCLYFNNDNSVFADNKALRQAVLYAIDMESVRLAFGNTETSGRVCGTFGASTMGDYLDKWDEEDYYGYDLEKAQALMAEAGYPDGGLKLRVIYVKNTAVDSCMAVMQSYLAQVGIEVELESYEQAMFDTLKYDNTKWDICIDQKGNQGTFLSVVWNDNFNPKAFENGSACFTHDDKLVELLTAACNAATHTDETVDAFHQYLKEQAYAVGMFMNYEYFVAQPTIQMRQDGNGNLTPSCFTVSDDYVSFLDR